MGQPDLPPSTEGRQAAGLRVCLVTALNIADFVDPELTASAHKDTCVQLGVLTIAASLRAHGFQPDIVNLDDLFLVFLKQGAAGSTVASDQSAGTPVEHADDTAASGAPDSGHFAQFVSRRLDALAFDVVGLSSICSSYPLTLLLAQEIKRIHPGVTIVLGGPQASVVDVQTMQAFRCVDFVVRGEADETFLALLHRLSQANSEDWESLAGITFRRGERVIRNRSARVISRLDDLPLPAYDLDPDIRRRTALHLEIGRGCPFACTFCSTSEYFRRKFRLKSPLKILEQMEHLRQEYGTHHIGLVHDLYTVDRKRVVVFCQALLRCEHKFTWGCSARTDCIDDELIGLMADAGCNGIFFGIETGSAWMQQVINKKLDLAESRKRIQCADRHGIETAVALIIGFPEETRDDLRDTIHFFVDALRLEHAEPQISLLAPLAGTPIHELHKDRLVFDSIFSDLSFQGWRQDPAELEMIKAYPEIFPNFYAVPTTWLDRHYLRDIADFVTYLATWFHWLPVALRQDSGDFLAVFERWQAWLANRRAAGAAEDTGFTPYYSHRTFRKEFLAFVQTVYLPEMARAPTAIAALVRTEGMSEDLSLDSSALPASSDDDLGLDRVPHRSENLLEMELDIDYAALIECLRQNTDLRQVPQRTSTVAFLAMDAKQESRTQVWQLAPLSALLLRLCDGTRTVAQIMQAFPLLAPSFDGISAETACLFGLMQLRHDGFITIVPAPAASE